MIPLFKSILNALLHDEMAARRWIRGFSHTFAVSGAIFADQIAEFIHAPRVAITIKAISVFCAFVGGTTSVGEKNAPSN